MVTTARNDQDARLTGASRQQDSAWTLAAFGALAYICSNVLHEGLGHGGAAWLSGAQRIILTSTYMEAGLDTRWILAAGTLVNLACGLAGLAWLSMLRAALLALRLFVWVLTAFHLLLGTGYFLFSGVGGVGDWAVWTKGLSPEWAWRAGFALLGAVSYFASGWILSRKLVEIVGRASRRRFFRLCAVPYISGCTAACAAGIWAGSWCCSPRRLRRLEARPGYCGFRALPKTEVRGSRDRHQRCRRSPGCWAWPGWCW